MLVVRAVPGTQGRGSWLSSWSVIAGSTGLFAVCLKPWVTVALLLLVHPSPFWGADRGRAGSEESVW